MTIAALDLRGLLNVFVIMVVAGAIAYIGDRVGHIVGRRRLTLFGLRPRYTSTISAVVFGMLIAVVALIFVSVFVKNARVAIFSIAKLNDEITALTADRDRLVNFMREEPLVFRKDEVLTPPVTVSSRQTLPDIQREIGLFFAEVANYYRRASPDVRPYPKDPLTSPGVTPKIAKLATVVKSFAPYNAIIVPVAGENIFRGTNMSISFEVYRDELLYRKGEIIASVEVANARDIDRDRTAIYDLINRIVGNAISHGMPPVIANIATASPLSADRATHELESVTGPAVITAKATRDVYAEGPLLWDLSVAAKST